MCEIPSSLENIQYWFANLITSPILQNNAEGIPLFSPDLIHEIHNTIAPSPTLSSEERLGIYQQQYWWRLIGVMQELFPSLVALLGYVEFNQTIAEPFLAAHIPRDWFISHIGLDLPHWLQSSNIKSDFPLKDLAELDLVYENLLFTEILPSIDPSQSEKEIIYLQPFVLLFQLNSDLFSFREQLLQEKKPSPQTLKKWRKNRFFVLYRLKEKNHYEEIDPIFFKILSQFQKGSKLHDLTPLLLQCEDVVSLFQTMAQRGWLTSCFSVPGKIFTL